MLRHTLANNTPMMNSTDRKSELLEITSIRVAVLLGLRPNHNPSLTEEK